MKNSSLFNYTHTLNNLFTKQILVIALLLLISSQLEVLHAQSNARLSVQGILKKASGEAVTDDVYNLKFKLWTAAEGGTLVWTEEQDSLEVIGGIYSTVLGNITPLSIPFNQTYFLGVTLGTTEMKPRVQLTSAPYALALIGTTNQFPSGGQVIMDSMKVNGNILTDNGEPGPNGSFTNGYGFKNDRDSGLFGPVAGEASIYVNNNEIIEAKPTLVDVKTDLTTGDVIMKPSGNIKYNTLDDWRLVDIDYFTNGTDNWQSCSADPGEGSGWSANGGAAPTWGGGGGSFTGRFIRQLAAGHALKKEYDLNNVGTYSFIKIKFKYYYFDNWDGSANSDRSYAGIAKTFEGDSLVIGYTSEARSWKGYGGDIDTPAFNAETDFGASGAHSDYSENAEMTFFRNTDPVVDDHFTLIFGASLNSDITDEQFGVGMIEIWVK